ARERDPVSGAEQARGDVAHQREARDQDHEPAHAPRIEGAPRIDRAVGQHGQHDEGRDQQLQRRVEVVAADPLDEPVQRLLEGERGRGGDRQRDRDLRVAEEHGAAEQVGHDRGHLGREPELALAARGRGVARHHERGHHRAGADEHPRRAELHREPGADRAGLREQDEGAQPADAALLAPPLLDLLLGALLALEPDERPDEQGDREVDERDRAVGQHPADASLRRMPTGSAPRPARRRTAGAVVVGVFLSIAVGAHLYLVQRLVLAPAWPAAPRAGLIAAIALGFAALVSQAFLRRRSGGVTRALAWTAYTWLGLAFLLLVATFASDAAMALLGAAAPAGAVDGAGVARGRALVVGAVGLVAAGVALRRGLAPPTLQRVEVPLARWPRALDGFRIVQLSDVHLGPLLDRRFAASLVERVNALAPDLVVVTGDLVDGGVRRVGAEVEPLGALRARHGVFFVTGNHDYYSG